jgi:hypothetical protein
VLAADNSGLLPVHPPLSLMVDNQTKAEQRLAKKWVCADCMEFAWLQGL